MVKVCYNYAARRAFFVNQIFGKRSSVIWQVSLVVCPTGNLRYKPSRLCECVLNVATYGCQLLKTVGCEGTQNSSEFSPTNLLIITVKAEIMGNRRHDKFVLPMITKPIITFVDNLKL